MANVMSDNQLEFNLGEDEVTTDVEVTESPEINLPENDTVEAEQEEKPAVSAQRNELDQVSENVQRRIAKLTAKMREAERREQAALEYAKNVQSQAQVLQHQLVQTDQSRMSETKTRMDTQQATLRSIIRRAREEGDIETETEAQEKLSELTYEQRKLHDTVQAQQYQAQQQQYQAQQQQVAAQQPKRPTPSPRAEEWAEQNQWFGKDRTMTYAAWGLHQTLVDEEGIDPNSDEYYTELDNRLRTNFPTKFAPAPNTQRQRSNVPAVAPASRSSGVNSARRSVRLSPSQVAIAKKLGVPLEEYAKYVKE
jgi:hypothetical protein